MHLFSQFSYLGIFLLVGMESLGIPLPGETALLTAAVIAGTTHKLNIYLIIFAAISGAIVGDNIGFWIGQKLGKKFLLRYGPRVGLTEKKLKLGQYLFNTYGGNIVFFGRFFSILRILAAFLAGVNNMMWRRFLLFNAAGAIVWASIYGFGGYSLGKVINKFDTSLQLYTLLFGVAILIGITVFIRKNEKRLEEKAEKAMPGPLEKYQ